MRDKLSKFFNNVRSPQDFLLLCRITAWIVVTPLALRILSMPSVMEFFSPGRVSVAADSGYREKVLLYTVLVLGRQKAMFRRNCLKRCLVSYRFLRMAGEPVVFHLGVRKEADGNLAGHSWLEIDGKPVFDERESYRITYSYPVERNVTGFNTRSRV